MAGCGADGLGPGGLPLFDDVDGVEELWSCDGDPGPVRVELCDDDPGHTPLSDGAEFAIARRPQGEITIFAPLWFGGLQGGEALSDLRIVFVDGHDNELGSRVARRQVLPCDEEGHVVADWLEVFFDRSAQPEDYDGVPGVLHVEATAPDGTLLFDEIEAVLRAE